jgi:hypothetical protein
MCKNNALFPPIIVVYDVNFLPRVSFFGQVTYIAFLDVHTIHLCYLSKKWHIYKVL